MPETVFLDRDGVINRKRPEGDYVKCFEEFEFLPGALDGLRLLTVTGARLIIVTNQRGIARGRMTAGDLLKIHERMRESVAAAGGRVDGIYYCPHEEGTCGCRKPRVGMFLAARSDDPGIDFSRAVVVGDSVSDLAAAHTLGCPGVLVASGKRRSTVLAEARAAGLTVAAAVPSLLAFGQRLAALGSGRDL